MKNCIAFMTVVSIMTALSGCTVSEQHPGPAEQAAPEDPHLALKEYVESRLDGALMPGWELMQIEQCEALPGWVSQSGKKGWHLVIKSAPDPEADGWRVACHFWAFQDDWVGRKRPLKADSKKASALYYGQSDRLMLFVQPPENPAATSMAVAQVALALGVPDVRAEAASQDKQKVRAMRDRLLSAAGADRHVVVKMVDRMIETRFAVIVFVRNRSGRDGVILLRALREAFPDKKTFVINRLGQELQDSIVAGGKR